MRSWRRKPESVCLAWEDGSGGCPAHGRSQAPSRPKGSKGVGETAERTEGSRSWLPNTFAGGPGSRAPTTPVRVLPEFRPLTPFNLSSNLNCSSFRKRSRSRGSSSSSSSLRGEIKRCGALSLSQSFNFGTPGPEIKTVSASDLRSVPTEYG